MPITDIVTPEYLRTSLLGGIIPLVSRAGNVFCDDALWAAIDQAVNYLENTFGLALTSTRFKDEGQRTRITQFSDDTYNMTTSLRRPVQSVTKLAVEIGNQEWYELPAEWVYITSKEQGVLQLVPTSKGVASYKALAPGMLRTWFVAGPYVPGYYSVTYRAGFEEQLPGTHTATAGSATVVVTNLPLGGDMRQLLKAREWAIVGGRFYRVQSVGETSYTLTNPMTDDFTGTAEVARYDSSILAYIAYAALLPILATLGATLYGAGVIGTSLRLDGMAQAKSLNPKGPFASIIDEYTKQVEAARNAIYAKYAPINIALLG